MQISHMVTNSLCVFIWPWNVFFVLNLSRALFDSLGTYFKHCEDVTQEVLGSSPVVFILTPVQHRPAAYSMLGIDNSHLS